MSLASVMNPVATLLNGEEDVADGTFLCALRTSIRMKEVVRRL